MGRKKASFFRVIICFLLSFITLFPSSTAVSALTDQQRLIYAQNNLIFYNPDENLKDCTTSAAGLVMGDDNAAKVWNYFVTANIPGVSDNAAVIAGIMGNLQQESGFNPFSHDSGSSYYGLFQTDNSGILAAMDAAGISAYYGQEYTNVPTDVNDNALKTELDLLVAWDRFSDFVGHLDWVSHTTGVEGARSYAELFLVTVEIAVNGNSPLEDPRVIAYVDEVKYRSLPAGTYRNYQETNKRRDYAEQFFNTYASSGAATTTTGSTSSGGSSSSSFSSSTNSSITWDDAGWISGMPGITKEDVTTRTDLNEQILGKSYENGKPNKILLHSTEGTSNGYDAYPVGNKYPAHFIVDLKKKEGYQNVPIGIPSAATKGADNTTVQIEIVGFSGNSNSDYGLQNFSDDDWDYLAVLLAAIANNTGIPLTTSVDWSVANHNMNQSDFNNMSGIVGHRHSPGDDHDDPGNIWSQVEAAIKRNPDASKFASGGDVCRDTSGSGLVSGGMTLEQANSFMEEYRSISPRFVSQNPQLAEWGITATTSCTSDLENCVAFSKYFLNRYTSISTNAVGNGSEVVGNLSKNFGLPVGDKPQPYAIFSTASGTTMCGPVLCGHTGVVLGIDEANNKIIIGEAGCSQPFEWTGAHEKDLSKYTDGSYTYAYTDSILNLQGVK